MEECDRKDWFVSDKFGISIPYSATYFLEVGARVSLKVATIVFFRGKNVQKFSFFKAYSLTQKRGSATKAIYVFQRILERSATFWK